MDSKFLLTAGLLWVAAQWVYGLTGWPCPGLVKK
jgi:hypothetical protein